VKEAGAEELEPGGPGGGQTGRSRESAAMVRGSAAPGGVSCSPGGRSGTKPERRAEDLEEQGAAPMSSAEGQTRGGDEARRVLVSGGAGFVGSHLCDLLLSRGDHVTVVDNLSTGRRVNLPSAHERLRFIEADLRDALHAFGPGEKFDEIYHLAAAVGVKLVMEKPIAAIETNVEETAAILRFALSRGRDAKGARILITSSSEVYGKPTKEKFSEEDDVVYGPTTVTRWSYACSKAIDEYLALAHHRQSGLPAVVVRLFNTVGPRQLGEYGMVLPRFVASALKGEPIVVHGDGRQTRCFCDVRDVVRVLPVLLSAPACHGRVFNVGSDKQVSIGFLADEVVRVLGSGSQVKKIAYAEAFANSPGASSASAGGEGGTGFEDLRHRGPDLSRLRGAVGFEPRIGLDETIRDVAAWIGAAPSGSRGAGGGA
jgi:UDP-glucose 4-epimerase